MRRVAAGAGRRVVRLRCGWPGCNELGAAARNRVGIGFNLDLIFGLKTWSLTWELWRDIENRVSRRTIFSLAPRLKNRVCR
jgi:hypothetical protein